MASVPNSGSAAPLPPVWDARPAEAAIGRPAGFWIRLVALLIDGLILGVLFAVVGGILAAVVGLDIEDPENITDAEAMAAGGFGIGLAVILILAAWLYEAILTSSARGATWGKQAMGLRVLRADGVRLSFGRATARYFSKAIVTPLLPLFIGYLLAAFTRRKQALHDFMADTVVLWTS
ncbi:MAG: RDD family protein [Proteobacteria bacterium]|nr:RDD family protein [Pseudomonadota bacterium]